MEPEVGSTATARLRVGPTDLASEVALEPGDRFPSVFATARLVAVMEVAASRLLEPFLAPGEMSVGVLIETSHIAPTPLGATVTATARFLGKEDKLYLFEVSAADEGGEIGRGRHKRAIVSSERLVARARARAGAQGR
jgi:predicted thioesterase